jgi:hypothetical protein
VGPTDLLSSAEGGAVVLPDGSSIALAAGGEAVLSWSQSLECAGVEVRRGALTFDPAREPLPVHVSVERLGVRLADVRSPVQVVNSGGVLAVVPSSALAFPGPDGPRALPAGKRLLFGPSGDSIDDAPAAPGPVAPAPEPVKPAAAAPVDVGLALSRLGATSYRYVSRGRRLREGAWAPDAGLLSVIEGWAAWRSAGGADPDGLYRWRNGGWADAGSVPRGGPERTVELLRTARPPHAILALALAATGGEPEGSDGIVAGRPVRVLRFPFVPERIRPDVAALLDRIVEEERMEKPFEVLWETLEGSLEIAVAKDDGAVLRANDLRRVAFRAGPAQPRTWYRTESTTTFADHGRPNLAAPPARR